LSLGEDFGMPQKKHKPEEIVAKLDTRKNLRHKIT